MTEQPNISNLLNKWLRRISPFIIGIIVCIYAILNSIIDFEKSEGWSFIGIIIFVPALLVLFLVDFVVKQIFKEKAGYIWLAELVLIAIGIFVFFTFIYG